MESIGCVLLLASPSTSRAWPSRAHAPAAWTPPRIARCFYFNDPATTDIYTLSLHDALPILIRQGKLDAAIAEFVRLVEDQPRDWNGKNSLADLYARAGKVDKAVEQLMEIAGNLNDEGAVAKAGAVYKKILKLKPDHEHGLLQVSEILGGQGLYADARAHLNTLIELRRAKGDVRGVLQAKIRLGSLDPEDYDGRRTASSARIEMGDKAGALSDLKDIAAALTEKGRQAEAVEVLRDAAKLHPDDEESRERL